MNERPLSGTALGLTNSYKGRKAAVSEGVTTNSPTRRIPK